MEEFITFSNTVGGRVMIRKSTIISVYEDDPEGEVTVSTSDGDEFGTNETFDSIISKITK